MFESLFIDKCLNNQSTDKCLNNQSTDKCLNNQFTDKCFDQHLDSLVTMQYYVLPVQMSITTASTTPTLTTPTLKYLPLKSVTTPDLHASPTGSFSFRLNVSQ